MQRSKGLRICHSNGFGQVHLKHLEWASEPHQTNAILENYLRHQNHTRY
jgi:hypothetical protein